MNYSWYRTRHAPFMTRNVLAIADTGAQTNDPTTLVRLWLQADCVYDIQYDTLLHVAGGLKSASSIPSHLLLYVQLKFVDL